MSLQWKSNTSKSCHLCGAGIKFSSCKVFASSLYPQRFNTPQHFLAQSARLGRVESKILRGRSLSSCVVDELKGPPDQPETLTVAQVSEIQTKRLLVLHRNVLSSNVLLKTTVNTC
jgi:hypothetical protein